MTVKEMQYLQEIGCFTAGLDERLLDENVYRTTGIHYSDLSSVYTNDLDKLNPETKDAKRQSMDDSDVIQMGRHFEYYLEYAQLPDNITIVKERPSVHKFLSEMIDMMIHMKSIEGVNTDMLIAAAKKKGFWKSMNDEKIADRVNPLLLPGRLKDYIAQERQLLKETDVERLSADDAHRITSGAMRTKSEFFDQVGEEFWQVPLMAYVGDIPFAILVDRMVVNAVDKVIYVDDIKYTQRKATKWNSYYWWYGYWIQDYIYTSVIEQCLADGWELERMNFVVGSHEEPTKPMRWFSDKEQLIDIALNGYRENGKNIPSIKELVETYHWHINNDLYDHKREYYERNKRLKIPLL